MGEHEDLIRELFGFAIGDHVMHTPTGLHANIVSLSVRDDGTLEAVMCHEDRQNSITLITVSCRSLSIE